MSSANDEACFPRVASFRGADVEGLDRIEAREIGFDFARRGMKLPDASGVAMNEGWLEGCARFGQRADGGTPWDRKLLRLRYSAWRRSRIVDRAVTAAYLERIGVPSCPITRESLTAGTHGLSDATIDRVFNDGGYAVGNLVVMSQRANLAKANRTIDEVIDIADRLADGERHEGLGRPEWARLASLCSLAQPSECTWHVRPLLVWPPRGLMISNAHAVVMVGASLMATSAPWLRSAFAKEIGESSGGKKARKEFDAFVATLRLRLAGVAKAATSPPGTLWPIEDAWASGLVWQRFRKFDGSTSPGNIAAMRDAIVRAMRSKVAGISDAEFAGWAIETRGYLRERRDELAVSHRPS